MDLDWDWPEFPPAGAGDEAPGPVAIEAPPVHGARLAPAREREARQAIEDSRRDFEANPGDAQACNSLAWDYLMAPEPLRDAKAAMPLAEKAVRLAPENPNYR